MMKIMGSAAVLLLMAGAVSAGLESVGEIRAYYNEVKDSLDDEYGRPYITEIDINTEDSMYPAVGHYQEHITFYWGSEGGMLWPLLVTWTSEHAAWSEHGELLFPEPQYEEDYGNMDAVFQFISTWDMEGNRVEYRWWWSTGGELLRSQGKTIHDDGSVEEFVPEEPSSYTYTKTPDKLKDLFLLIHG